MREFESRSNPYDDGSDTPVDNLCREIYPQFSSNPHFVELIPHYQEGGIVTGGTGVSADDSGLISGIFNVLTGRKKPAKTEAQVSKGYEPIEGIQAEMLIEVATRRSTEGRTLNAQIVQNIRKIAGSYGLKIRLVSGMSESLWFPPDSDEAVNAYHVQVHLTK